MIDYIAEKMAQVGCGSSDIKTAKSECDSLTKEARDILDCWHNNGFNVPLLPEYQKRADGLKERFDEDTLIVLAAYVAARRNLEEY